jgi:hypothetical protein
MSRSILKGGLYTVFELAPSGFIELSMQQRLENEYKTTIRACVSIPFSTKPVLHSASASETSERLGRNAYKTPRSQATKRHDHKMYNLL